MKPNKKVPSVYARGFFLFNAGGMDVIYGFGQYIFALLLGLQPNKRHVQVFSLFVPGAALCYARLGLFGLVAALLKPAAQLIFVVYVYVHRMEVFTFARFVCVLVKLFNRA